MNQLLETDLLLTCSACGDKTICPQQDAESQRTFKQLHQFPCPFGTNGERWPNA